MARQRARRGRSHLPAGVCRAGDGFGIHTWKQQCHPRFLCRQCKAAAGGKIQFAHPAPAFRDHRSQCRTTQGIDGRTQQSRGIGHHAKQAKFRRAPQFSPAIGLQHTARSQGLLRPQPQNCSIRGGHASRQGHGKSRCAGSIIALACIDFMYTTPGQPAAQRGIERGNAERVANCRHLCRTRMHRGRNGFHMFLLCSNLEEDQEGIPMFFLRRAKSSATRCG